MKVNEIKVGSKFWTVIKLYENSELFEYKVTEVNLLSPTKAEVNIDITSKKVKFYNDKLERNEIENVKHLSECKYIEEIDGKIYIDRGDNPSEVYFSSYEAVTTIIDYIIREINQLNKAKSNFFKII